MIQRRTFLNVAGAGLAASVAGAPYVKARDKGKTEWRLQDRPPRRSPGPRTTVERFNGQPTLMIDGVPSPAQFYMTYRPEARHFRRFAEAGVALSSFSCTGDACPYGICGPSWAAPDRYDYTQFDERMAMACAAPGTLVMPRIYTGAPDWWMDAHPDECVLYSNGRRDAAERAPSFSSALWREASLRAVLALIDHIERGPWADRILGYHIAGGITEEFAQFGCVNSVAADYSPACRDRFRGWLAARYGTDRALQAAWGNPAATLAAAEIPGRERRDETVLGGLFYDPARQRDVIDYNRFNGETIAGFIHELATAVKQRTGGDKVVGCFFGYLFGCGFTDRMLLESGYLALEHVLRSDAIDFLVSPSGYDERACGIGTTYFRAPVQSVQRAGKLWINENDLRTHRTDEICPEVTQPAGHTIAKQWREAAAMLTQAAGQWWFDMGGGWYDDPPTMAAVDEINRIAATALHADRRTGAEIALVVDADSFYSCGPNNAVSACFLEGLAMECTRVGAPVDKLLLADALEAPPYRLVIFAGGFALSETDRERVKRHFLREGTTVLWLYAPGYLRNGKAGPENIADLAGITVRHIPQHHRLLAWTDPAAGGPFRAEAQYGRHAYTWPMFDITDPEAEVWAHLHSAGTPGMAGKQVNGANSILSIASPPTSAMLRDLARFAGAHVYVDHSDASYVSEAFIGLHAWREGVREVALPESAALCDLATGEEFSAARRHRIPVEAMSTRLLFRGSQAEWNRISRAAGLQELQS